MNKLLVICGPTAVGKTNLAVSLAQKFDAELVSADSRQVYRGMDIVTGKDLTGKDTIEKLRVSVYCKATRYLLAPYRFHDVPMWLYDVVEPDQSFSVAGYQCLATAVIGDIQKSQKLPIVVGGTGLYIRSLLSPMETNAVTPNPSLRKQLSLLALAQLQQRLQTVDSQTWEKLNASDRQNPRRLVRKIEIAHASKGPHLASQEEASQKYNVRVIGLTAPLKYLYEKIDQRVRQRVAEGALGEIRSLQKKYPAHLPAMSGIGYRLGEGDESTLIQKWQYDEHAYARRQMTWFRKQTDICWFDVTSTGWQERAVDIVTAWYTKK